MQKAMQIFDRKRAGPTEFWEAARRNALGSWGDNRGVKRLAFCDLQVSCADYGLEIGDSACGLADLQFRSSTRCGPSGAGGGLIASRIPPDPIVQFAITCD